MRLFIATSLLIASTSFAETHGGVEIANGQFAAVYQALGELSGIYRISGIRTVQDAGLCGIYEVKLASQNSETGKVSLGEVQYFRATTQLNETEANSVQVESVSRKTRCP